MIQLIQIIFLTAQIGSLIFCVIKRKSPVETHLGVSIWGSLPVILLGQV